MIFVWTGRGWLIPCSLMVSIGLLVIPAPPGRFWPLTMAFALAGLFCVGLGLHGRFRPARWVRRPSTGCERFQRPRHTAYWIRAEYWGLIYLLFAIWLQYRHGAPQ